MILSYHDGDVFFPEGPIAHGCNSVGVMGAGVAKYFKYHFPLAYENYSRRCRAGMLVCGESFPMYENNKWTFCLLTQDQPGPHADLFYIQCAFMMMAHQCNKLNIGFVNIPRIGSGIGGLKWEDVAATIESCYDPGNLEVRVWTV